MIQKLVTELHYFSEKERKRRQGSLELVFTVTPSAAFVKASLEAALSSCTSSLERVAASFLPVSMRVLVATGTA